MTLRGILIAVGGTPAVELQRIVPGGSNREEALLAGSMHAVFKEDNDESQSRCSVSEWWPNSSPADGARSEAQLR